MNEADRHPASYEFGLTFGHAAKKFDVWRLIAFRLWLMTVDRVFGQRLECIRVPSSCKIFKRTYT